MSTLVLSAQCSTEAEWGDMKWDIEPNHAACPGGQHIPGVIGGWTCSCDCHRARLERLPTEPSVGVVCSPH